MSGVFFDTSALVPVVTEQLVNHVAAHSRFVKERKAGRVMFCSSHTLAECYATLTALPLPFRISGHEAARLIATNFVRNLRVIDLRKSDYQKAMHLCADRGRTSGQIYDALHLICAERSGCDVLLTYNLRQFAAFQPGRVRVSAP
jgi:predicted nucleic acid-binding protein